jgi:hypothetical protein
MLVAAAKILAAEASTYIASLVSPPALFWLISLLPLLSLLIELDFL